MGDNVADETKSLDKLLGDASAEVAGFDAKKARKADLEAFAAKAKASVKDYTNEIYEDQRKIWKDHNERIKRVYDALKVAYPDLWEDADEPWCKRPLASCICDYRDALRTEETLLAGYLKEQASAKEWARDVAKQDRDTAKARLDVLTSNAKKVKEWLDEDEKRIQDLCKEVAGPEPAGAIYSLWFQLLPRHTQLVAKVDKDCLSFIAEGETPGELCPKPEEPEPADADEAKSEAEVIKPPKAAPWIIAPSAYEGVLLEAWNDYDAKLAAYVSAEAELTRLSTNIASTTKSAEAARKSLTDDIKKCLNETAPPKLCGDEQPESARPAAHA
jgi:hypothetical protein